jgi:two-component system LytT family response regulator
MFLTRFAPLLTSEGDGGEPALASLAAALRRLATSTPATAPVELPAGSAWRMDDAVYLRSGQQARFVALTDICVIAASGNYSDVRLADGTKIFMRKSLKAWEDALPPTHFMRVHRTQIVNLARVTRYERDDDEHTRLYLGSLTEPVSASRYRWSELEDRLSAMRPAP